MKTVYHNGTVYTGEEAPARAFWVENGRFGRTGSDEEILAEMMPGDEKVDLKGLFVSPGFNDSHMHLLNFGQTLYGARLAEHTDSLAGMLAYLRDFLKHEPPRPGKWLTGRGWNQDYFADEKRMPLRQDLDGVSESVPIRITRACGHSCVLNSAALKLAGIGRDTPDPEGGRIGREESGEPDGRLYENAVELAEAAQPLPDKEQIKQMLLLAMEEAARYGLTSVQSDDYSTFRAVPWQRINEAYRELEAEGRLTLRVTEQCNFAELAAFKAFVEAGNVTGKGSEFFRTGPLKLLGDGSLGSRTAHLSQPYLTGGGCGMSLFPPDELKRMITFAHKNGMQIAVHAIGDACLDEVLDALEEAMTAHPRPDPRHGIVHCQVSRADQLERIARLGLHVYAQSIFLDYDNHIVEKLVPPALAAHSYSWKTLLKKGVCVSNGSDCPVELPNVLDGIECAVTRRSLDGTGPFLPLEAFSVKEALDSFTVSGARASFEEKQKGRIREGRYADFVILSADPFKTEARRLREIRPLATFLGGKRIWQAE